MHALIMHSKRLTVIVGARILLASPQIGGQV